MSLAQIGEFSFIIAGLGLSLKATGGFLYSVAVAVSAITTLLTPWLIRASGPFATWVDRRLPPSLQTVVALYGSWLERLRSTGHKSPQAARVRRLVRLLLVDAAVLAAIVVTTALGSRALRTYLVGAGALTEVGARALVITVAAAVAAPFCIGIARVGRKLAATIAALALPATADEGAVDLAAAPRRALVVTMQLGLLLLVGVPLVAITQPFLPGFHGAELLLAIVLVLALASWRMATDLQGHVRAGAQVVAEAIARQGHLATSGPVDMPPALDAILEGLGQPEVIAITKDSPADGKTLRQLDLRGATGATVLAISRGEAAIVVPSAGESLHAGDLVAVAGTRDAVAAARTLLSK
jgi:CPA2 family monovalent cation:H+ antiporter-2